MTTTLSWLQTQSHGRLALCLVFDGYDLIYTTTDDTVGIATAYSATQWDTVKSGLDIVGSITQRIVPFGPRIDTDSLTFRLLDHDDSLASTILREANSSTARTHLATDILPNATSITVADTTGFSSGIVYIGREAIDVTVSDTTHFTVSERGKWALWGTNSDADNFGLGHFGDASTERNDATAPQVLAAPRTWYNRSVALYLHHYEDGAWSARADARMLWAGRIKSYADQGDGWITLTCVDIKELLDAEVFREQWSGDIAEGVWIAEEDRLVEVRYSLSGGATTTLQGYLPRYDQRLNRFQLLEDVNSTLASLSTSTIDFFATMKMGEPRAWVKARKKTGNWLGSYETTTFGLAPSVWFFLGFGSYRLPRAEDAGVYRLARIERQGYEPLTEAYVEADYAPIRYLQGAIEPNTPIPVGDVVGTWQTQTNLPDGAPSGATGIAKTGDVYWFASYTGGGNPQLTCYAPYKSSPADTDPQPIREDEARTVAPRAEQVLFETGRAGTLLAQILLSTGSSGYNHSTYDVYARGLGCGLPAGLFDLASFDGINSDCREWELFYSKPSPLRKFIETICAITGRQIVFKAGKITFPKIGALRVADADFDLTESNKSRPDDRIKAERGVEGVINRLTLKYGYGFNGSEPGAIFNIINTAGASAYGAEGRTIEAQGLPIGIWTGPVFTNLTQQIAFLSHPLAYLTRTYNASLIDMVPGDTVLLTDNYMADPRTGTRGVTDHPCWVLSTSFDLRTGVGRVQLATTPTTDYTRIRDWAPSARVDDTAANGGYNTTDKILTCYASIYSNAQETDDALYFPTSSAIRVIELSPSDPASPQTWVDVVAAQSGNTITLTTGLSGWNSAKKYLVELDDVSTVSATLRGLYAFIADDADNSTGFGAPYRWGLDGTASRYVPPAIDYNQPFTTPVNIADDKGEPHSAAWWGNSVDNFNRLYSNKTAQHHLSYFATGDDLGPVSVAVGASKLVYGPVPIALYGHYTRALRVRVWGYSAASTTTTYTIKASPTPPTGASDTGLIFFELYNQATCTTTSTSGVWMAELSLTPLPLRWDLAPPYTLITVEMSHNGTSAQSVCFGGICVAEDSLG